MQKYPTLTDQLYVSFVCIYLIILTMILFFSLKPEWGFGFLTTRTYSMSPIIDPGSLTAVIRSDYYDVGDIISFYDTDEDGNEIIVTHRIIQIGGNVYVTKGDSNPAHDGTKVVPRLIIGKAIFIVPHLGYFLSFAKSTTGLLLLVWAPASLISIVEGYRVVRSFS